MFLTPKDFEPQNLPEKIVWYLGIGTYPLYLIGSLYLIVPLVGAGLAIYALWQWRQQTAETPILERAFISPAAWVWLVAGLVIEFAMMVAHFNFELGTTLMAISTVNNWYRRWAIIPLFILAGHFLIRPKLLYRVSCIIAVETAVVVLIGTILSLAGIPEIEYTSPLKIFGGGTDHYGVVLLQNALTDRINSFSPWVTTTGTLGNFFFFLSWAEKSSKWRIAGMVSSLMMVVVSQSRAALVCIPFVVVVVWLSKNIVYPRVQLLSSAVCFLLGLVSVQLGKLINLVQAQFANFRGKDSYYSSRTRKVLYRMTIKDWWENAPIWGHGRVPEEGPRVIGGMPIGTHHTWYGGLYTFGLVGCTAFAIAMVFTLINLIIQARESRTATVGLCIFLTFLVSTLTDSVEYVSYAYWSALLFIGIALRQPQEEIDCGIGLLASPPSKRSESPPKLVRPVVKVAPPRAEN